MAVSYTHLPPENQEFQAELKIFNQSYASAKIHSDESAKVMEADTSPEEYIVKDLVTVFIFLTVFSASATAALWMLRRLFAVLTRCESPFCCEVVNRMRGFGFSLLPVAVFASDVYKRQVYSIHKARKAPHFCDAFSVFLIICEYVLRF